MDQKSSQGRIRNILLFPRWEWKVIKLEQRSLKEAFVSYAFPLILAGAVSQFIGSFLYVRNELDIDAYRFSLPLIHAGFFIFLQVITLMLTTVFVYGLSGRFMSQKDYSKAGKVVIYSFTPLYLLYVLANLHASLTLVMLPAFYGLYLLWTGLPVMLETSARKLPAFVFIILISVLGILYISSRVLALLTILIFPGVS
ncbi:MAG: hypothetical protein CVU14_03830 [Bacteroidetes bacterium HGW-Bacteroidetes-9]|jgi:hypothetical protein|nr:MAG: hypothetical protein CVU14_03830 [Bacteroidetes bacterium HGW-Bacteroidetes-9]